MNFAPLLTARILGTAAAVVVVGGGAVTVALVSHHGSSPSGPAVAGPVATTPLLKGPGASVRATSGIPPLATHTPPPAHTATPGHTPLILHTVPPIATVAPGPPTISGLSVTPPTIHEYWAGGPADCASTYANDLDTYALVSATVRAPYGVRSATVYWSFGTVPATENSGSGAMELAYGSTTDWQQYIGGYGYTNFTIPSPEVITYYITVIDNHGNTVTSGTVTDTVDPCSPRDQ